MIVAGYVQSSCRVISHSTTENGEFIAKSPLRRPRFESTRRRRRFATCAQSNNSTSNGKQKAVQESPKQVVRNGEPHDVSVILLAGGVGKRMGGAVPKQMLTLGGKTILERSLEVLSQLREVSEIVVVLAPSLRDTVAGRACEAAGVIFAEPGVERVDSVASGVAASNGNATLFCVHDAARPLVRREDVERVIRDGWKHGAAVLGVRCKATIKSSEDGQFVEQTLDRSKLWEMQTPQVIDAATLRAGLAMAGKARDDAVAVTDDVSLVELLKLPVFLTEGEYDNIKITTPEDLLFAESVLDEKSLRKS